MLILFKRLAEFGFGCRTQQIRDTFGNAQLFQSRAGDLLPHWSAQRNGFR